MRASIIVTGTVQGVGYRAFVRAQALGLNLLGWTYNHPGGQVETQVEGAHSLILQLIRGMRQGPPLARVDDVQIDWSTTQNRFADFTIRY